MAPSPFFSGRIPVDLYERIEQHVKETGESKTQVLVNALNAYLEHPVSTAQPPANAAEARLAAVEEKLALLSAQMAELKACLSKPGNGRDRTPPSSG